MALTNKDTTVITAEKVQPTDEQIAHKVKMEKLATLGVAELASMDEARKALLGSKSGTLHFKYLLGLQSRKSTRVAGGEQVFDSFTPYGVALISDEDISVPEIDITRTTATGVEPKDIGVRHIAAKQPFELTYIEFMFLILRDEYAGMLALGDDPRGVALVAKMPKFFRGEAKLPTPTIEFVKAGSAKETMVAMDYKLPTGAWAIKPEYAAKFGALLRSNKPVRVAGESKSLPNSLLVAVALRKILNIN